VQFWVDAGRYDIVLHDTEVPARMSDRTIQFNSIPLDGIVASQFDADVLAMFVPIGGILPYAGSGDPAGLHFLMADGRLINRTTYASFFTVAGHAYNGGVDPGSNQVRIPDKRGRSSVGADNMLGTRLVGSSPGAAGRMPNSNRALGQNGGEERHTQTLSELVAHAHVMDYQYLSTSLAGTGTQANWAIGGGTRNTTTVGSTTPMNVMHPYEIDNYIVRIA